MAIEIKPRNKNYLQITTPFDEQVINAVKKIPGRKWIPKEKVWIYPDLDSNTQLFLSELYKLDRFNYTSTQHLQQTPLETMQRYMKLKNYSPKTIRAYEKQIRWFFSRTALNPSVVTTEDITLYIEKMKSLTGCSRSFIVQCISALKMYYNNGGISRASNPAANIPLPKKEYRYPDILSRVEVRMLIENGTNNLKHEFLLTLIYSAGLRVSEAVNLKVNDLDFGRKIIHIRNSKGRRDRYVMLSEHIEFLFGRYKNRNYLEQWVFPGAKDHSHLTIRSAQEVFKNACRRTGIEKNVSIHSLRHAFATHLLEDGVDLRYIQELLGHKSSKTTEIYTHVTKASIKGIKSPVDSWKIPPNF